MAEDEASDSEDEEEEGRGEKSKKKKNKNPEYDRVWDMEDQGNVGTKVPEQFEPKVNLSETEDITKLISPYEFFRLFQPDDHIDEVVEQSKRYY